jgi:hypothetical protein
MAMRWEVQTWVYAMLPDGRGIAKIANAQSKASYSRRAAKKDWMMAAQSSARTPGVTST